MKSLMTLIISIGLFLLAVIAVLAVSRPASAHERDNDDHQKPHYQIVHNDKTGWQVPVLMIAVGAGVWCWFECKRPAPEPMPDPGPAVKVTPDNLSDNPIGVRVYQ